MQTAMDSPHGRIAPPESTIFAATLTPHRSLGRQGTLLLIGFVTMVSIISAVPFIVLGAWPIGGFFGLDVALLAVAFHVNNRRARAYEEIILSRIELLLRKVSWRRKVDELRFNPFWVRLKTEDDPDYGMQRITIVQRRQEVEVGAFLAPFERKDFAHAFGAALAEARR